MCKKTEQIIERFQRDGIRFLNEPPVGWRKLNGAATAPSGWEWWATGSRFYGGYQHALVRVKTGE